MADIEELSEEELINDAVYNQEPHPSPDAGHGIEEYEEEENNGSFVSNLSFCVELMLAFITYAYIMVSILINLIVPASFTPIVNHQINIQQPNTTDAIQLLKVIGHNGLLMLLFFVQHSIMSHLNFKGLLDSLNMGAFTRALYTLCTCIVLQIIRWLWKPMSHYIWHCPDDSTSLFVAMVTVHVLCWFFLAMTLFTTDYLELLGIKQIYYHYKGFGSPLLLKSEDQQELLTHMRHPVFLSPLLILWFVPTMTYDRLFLAIMIPLYLLWGNRLRETDVDYVQYMYKEKKNNLFTVNNKVD